MFLLVRRFLAAFAFFPSIYLSYHSDMMVVLPSNEHKARGFCSAHSCCTGVSLPFFLEGKYMKFSIECTKWISVESTFRYCVIADIKTRVLMVYGRPIRKVED
jgi:hypothetical protein